MLESEVCDVVLDFSFHGGKMIVESFKLGSTDIDFFEELIVNVDLSLLSRRNAREDLDLFLRR